VWAAIVGVGYTCDSNSFGVRRRRDDGGLVGVEPVNN
jgi:hypothetical protein